MPRLIIDEVRKRKKLSKRKVAQRMEEEYRHVFRYFKPDYNPTFETLCKLAAAMKCKVRDLIEG